MAAVRTYILAPNFQYKPSGPIQIGNIIADPFQPARALSNLPEHKAPDIETITEYAHELTQERGHSIGIGFWAQFLQSIGANVSVDHGKDILQEYSIEELETRYMRNEPLDNDADLAQRLAEPRVQTAIKAGVFGNQPVYMITGVKIARGLSVRTALSRTIGGGLGSTMPVVESVSVGGEITTERRNGITNSFAAGEEAIVFAYQLHKISRRGRKQNITTGVFESSAAFLHGDVESNKKADVSVRLATIDDLRNEDLVLEACELVDDDGVRCACISAKNVV
ncbi:hypothetical protein FSARC_12036 [Fusarium sarcochroum]|uniref:Uncharacterized protein n=1 Tax=Fusarium sarcochroum TaxID=1208366 RepID=A0A8H4WYT3_9HYPO|nr:hypothetical protein FSARC_12036 [Fusarium sarcochroum]